VDMKFFADVFTADFELFMHAIYKVHTLRALQYTSYHTNNEYASHNFLRCRRMLSVAELQILPHPIESSMPLPWRDPLL